MNWKKLTIGITLVNVLGWILLELWSFRYADSNISGGSGTMIFLHLLMYYIIVILSRIPDEIDKPNCDHDWQPAKYSDDYETCVKCNADRGIEKLEEL